MYIIFYHHHKPSRPSTDYFDKATGKKLKRVKPQIYYWHNQNIKDAQFGVLSATADPFFHMQIQKDSPFLEEKLFRFFSQRDSKKKYN